MDRIAVGEDLALDDDPAAFLRALVRTRHERRADAAAACALRLPLLATIFLEQLLRDLRMDSRAVAGLPVGIHRPAMPHRLQGGNAGLDQLPPRLPIDGRNEPDAARIMLLGRIV